MLKDILPIGSFGVIHGPTERQSDTAGRQRVADRPRVRDRPREPIALRNDERVALANGGERLRETGAFAVASCHSVTEIDAIVANPEPVQRIALRDAAEQAYCDGGGFSSYGS